MEDNKIVIYQTDDGNTRIDVRLENEMVWLNVSQMSALFNKEESTIRRHISNAFREGELERDENNVHFLHVNGCPVFSLRVQPSSDLKRKLLSMGRKVEVMKPESLRKYMREEITAMMSKYTEEDE